MSARVPTTYMAGYANMDILILDLTFLRSTSPSCFQATNQQWETTFAICVWTLQPSIPWFGFHDFRWCETASNSIPTDKKSDFLAAVASTTNAIGLRAWFVVNVEKHGCSRLWIRMNYWLHSYYRLSTTESSRLVHAELSITSENLEHEEISSTKHLSDTFLSIYQAGLKMHISSCTCIPFPIRMLCLYISSWHVAF